MSRSSRVLLIAWVRSVRTHRRMREKPLLLFFVAFPIVFGVLATVGELPLTGYDAVWSEPGAYAYGRELAGGNPGDLADRTRGLAGLLFVLVCYGAIIREATEGSMDRHRDGLLTSVSARTAALATLVENVAFNGRLVGLVVLAGAVAFGVGARAPLAVVSLLLAGTLLVASAVAVGYVVALSIRLAFRRVAFVREHKILVGGPLALGYFGLFVRARESMALLGALPVGWFADLGLVTVGVGRPGAAALVVVASGATVAASAAISGALGRRLWLGDGPEPPTPARAAEEGTGGFGRRLARVTSRPTAAVALMTWRRLRREPQALLFTTLPVVITVSVAHEIVDTWPDALPLVVAVYGSAAVGMGVTLNPLGNEGPILPAVLTIPDGGRNLLYGYVLSAALPGAAIVGTATLVATLPTALGPATAVGFALLGAGLAATAAGLSLGIGVALPQFEGLTATRSSGIQSPRLEAVTAFLLATAAVGTPALVGVVGARELSAHVGVSGGVLAAAGVLCTVLVAVAAAVLSVRYALARIGGYDVGG